MADLSAIRLRGRATQLVAALVTAITLGPVFADEHSERTRFVAHDNCTATMQSFPDRVPDPDAMCTCMIEAVDERFEPDMAGIVVDAMAADTPGEGLWDAWTTASALRAAGELSEQQATSLSDAVRERLGGEVQQQCAAFEPEKPAQSTGSAGAPEPAAQAEACGNKSCLVDNFRLCRPAAITDDQGALGTLKIEVLGPEIDHSGDCDIRVWYSDSPNTDWTNLPLTMTLQAGKPFEQQFVEGLETCLTSAKPDELDCSGPLHQLTRLQ